MKDESKWTAGQIACDILQAAGWTARGAFLGLQWARSQDWFSEGMDGEQLAEMIDEKAPLGMANQ